jgi:hypothetical protein
MKAMLDSYSPFSRQKEFQVSPDTNRPFPLAGLSLHGIFFCGNDWRKKSSCRFDD